MWLRLIKALFSGSIKGHFGQWAEDVLVRKQFHPKKKTGIYLDLGAYHPFSHSNSAFLWLKGWKGFNVDANQKSIDIFNRVRCSDKNICCALISQSEWDRGTRFVSLNFVEGIDTEEGISASAKIIEFNQSTSVKVQTKTINQLISEFNIKSVDYLNVDIEGVDEHILAEFPFDKVLPAVITVEDYSQDLDELIKSNISRHLSINGYRLIGRVGLTSVFRHKDYIW